MARLASPPNKLQTEYEVVVVGSGYGDGVSASRLARAGRSVCVLERGRECQPGEFPDEGDEARAEMQANAHGHQIGSEVGLYEFHFDVDLNIFKGCGLGGTSLVNASVALEADPRLFEDPRWSEILATDREGPPPGGLRARPSHAPPSAFPPYPGNSSP